MRRAREVRTRSGIHVQCIQLCTPNGWQDPHAWMRLPAGTREWIRITPPRADAPTTPEGFAEYVANLSAHLDPGA
jgi:hypothetical protein